MRWSKKGFVVTDNKKLLPLKYVVAALRTTYFGESRSRELIKKSWRNSTVLSLFVGKKPIGFVRLISDKATFTYICDFYVDPNYRGQGLGQWLLKCVMQHPVGKVSGFLLLTRDAQKFYKKCGFHQNKSLQKAVMGMKR
jgi:ribosomal protein S18 acetylase RimI-like enzyme